MAKTILSIRKLSSDASTVDIEYSTKSARESFYSMRQDELAASVFEF